MVTRMDSPMLNETKVRMNSYSGVKYGDQPTDARYTKDLASFLRLSFLRQLVREYGKTIGAACYPSTGSVLYGIPDSGFESKCKSFSRLVLKNVIGMNVGC